VHLRGLIGTTDVGKIGVATYTMFELPVGYRPDRICVFASIGDTGIAHAVGRIDVQPGGAVCSCELPAGRWLTLDGICFLAGR